MQNEILPALYQAATVAFIFIMCYRALLVDGRRQHKGWVALDMLPPIGVVRGLWFTITRQVYDASDT